MQGVLVLLSAIEVHSNSHIGLYQFVPISSILYM